MCIVFHTGYVHPGDYVARNLYAFLGMFYVQRYTYYQLHVCVVGKYKFHGISQERYENGKYQG